MAVFDGDHPTQWRSKERRSTSRERLEGKLVEIGMRAAQLGLDVVFDFGLWSRDERSALRWDRGLPRRSSPRSSTCRSRYEEQRRRVSDRYDLGPGQFKMSDAELQEWHGVFHVPDEEELRGDRIPAVPPGYATWAHWASQRWPSLPPP